MPDKVVVEVASPATSAPPVPKFFQCGDDAVYYIVVALDMEGAKHVLRAAGVEFGDPSVPLDQAEDLTWKEIPAARAASIRCDTGDDDRVSPPHIPGLIPLIECDLGEYFCSEW